MQQEVLFEDMAIDGNEIVFGAKLEHVTEFVDKALDYCYEEKLTDDAVLVIAHNKTADRFYVYLIVQNTPRSYSMLRLGSLEKSE